MTMRSGATADQAGMQSRKASTGQPAGNHTHIKASEEESRKTNAAQRYLASLKPSGRRSQRWALREMGIIWKRRAVKDASRLDWSRITRSDVDRIRQVLRDKYAIGTANRALVALRQVLLACWEDGSLSQEAYMRLKRIKQIPGDGERRGRALTQDEINRLYEVCARDTTPAGCRDGAAIALAHAAGLRSGEVVGLDLGDVVDADRGELMVSGKGGTRLPADLGAAASWLTRWLANRGSTPGPLILPVYANGKVGNHRLSPAAVFQILRKRARQAGVTDCSPHCLRKTFATSLFRAGFDQVMVMRSLRHRDLRSVHIYDRRTEDERAAAQRAAIKVPVPGGSK